MLGEFFVIVLVVIVIILFVVGLTINRNNRGQTPEIRGKVGENMVKLVVGETIENRQYVINDLIVENNGKTSQIDHIVINPRGVFVIETKNYSGEIYGSENQLEWTQVLAYGNVKNKLYNPIKQNATHIYNVQKIVGGLPIRSFVVFVQNNTQHIEANNVIPLSALKSALQSGESVLSTQQMKKAYEALLASKKAITTQEHVQNIKKQQHNLEQGICPRCGKKLVLRTGKYGNFWGCSNYPKCKFIKKK